MRAITVLALLPITAFAQWQADLESGQGDALGAALFFFAFFAYVHIKDAAKESSAKAWRAAALCAAVAVAVWFVPALQLLLVGVFLVSLLHYFWTSIKGPK